MAYWDQAQLSTDNDFGQRIAACAAVEIDLVDQTAIDWAVSNQWEIAASPGFADKYASGIANGIPDPGRNPAVITDGDILSAVQALATDA